MNFKFKTIRQTRNALNAQQIYWEYIKLKKYFRMKTISGEEKKSEIIFHRTQLPYKFKTIDMGHLLEQQQENSNSFYYITIAMSVFSIMHFYAKLLYDDDTKYWVSIRFPYHMKYFNDFHNLIYSKYDQILQKLEIKDKDLQGTVGYHNVKEGIKSLFKKEEIPIDYSSSDQSIQNLDNFLQEQDKKVLKSIK